MSATAPHPEEHVRFQRAQAVLDAFADMLMLEPPDQWLDQVAERVMHLTGATGGVVELIEKDELVYAAAAGRAAAHRGLRLSRPDSLSGLCARTGEPQFAPDTHADARVDRVACERIGARSMMLVPLPQGPGSIGVLKVVSDRPHAFTAEDGQVLRLAAGVVAAAIVRRHTAEQHASRAQSTAAFSARMASAIAASPTAMMIHDLDGIIEVWNPAAEALIGWPASECIGHFPPYLTPGEADRFRELTRQVLWTGQRATVLRARFDRKGQPLNLRVSAAPVLDDSGQIVAIVRTFEDITAELALAAAQGAVAERVRRIIDRSVDAFVSMDATGLVTEWNASAEALFGWTRQEAIGHPLDRLIVPPAQRQGHQSAVERYLLSGSSQLIGRRIEMLAQRKDGTPVAIEASVTATRMDGTVMFDAFMSDITQRRAERELLQQQALHDSLTGLPNRTHFNARLAMVHERHRHSPNRAALVFIDLDGFKAINDTHGHITGDAVLRAAADRMRGCVRANDMVARLAGDEFVIVLEDLQDAHANVQDIADKLVAAFSSPLQFDGTALTCRASIGIAVLGLEDQSMADLVRRADRAMYQAKRAGGGRAVLADGSA